MMASSTRSTQVRSRPLKDTTGSSPQYNRLAVWSGSARVRGPHRGLGAQCEREGDRADARPTVAGSPPGLTVVGLSCAAVFPRFLFCQFWPIAGAPAGLELDLAYSSECRRLLVVLCIPNSTMNACSRRRRAQRATGFVRGQSSHSWASIAPLRGRPAVVTAGPVLGCSSSGEEAGRCISSGRRLAARLAPCAPRRHLLRRRAARGVGSGQCGGRGRSGCTCYGWAWGRHTCNNTHGTPAAYPVCVGSDNKISRGEIADCSRAKPANPTRPTNERLRSRRPPGSLTPRDAPAGRAAVATYTVPAC